MEKVKEIMEAREKAEQSSSSDKENEDNKETTVKKELDNATKTYSKKANPEATALKQKVLSFANNGSLTVGNAEVKSEAEAPNSEGVACNSIFLLAFCKSLFALRAYQ